MNPRASVRRSVCGSAALVIAAVAAASCSPPPPPPATPSVAVAPSAAPPVTSPLDLGPVEQPESLSGVLRIGSPIRDLVMWRDLLPAHTPMGQLAALGPEGVADLALGSLGRHVDLEAPLDALFLKGQPSHIVVSLVLRDLAEARRSAAADFDIVALDDGSFDVRPRSTAKAAGLIAKMKLSCGIFPGGTPVVHHLICSAKPPGLEAGAPYLARNVARNPAAPGMHYAAPESAFRDAMAEAQQSLDEEADLDKDPSDAAGRRLGRQWAAQLGSDFKTAAMDLTATPEGVALGVDVHFRSLRSPFSLAVLGTRSAAVPAVFWTLPADAGLALCLPGAAPDAMRAAIGTMWTDFAETAPTNEIPREAWRKVTDGVSQLLFTGGPLVVAHGTGTPRAVAAPAAAPHKTPAASASAPATDPAKRFREARTAAAGWVVFAMPEPSSKWTTGVRDIFKIVVARPKKPSVSGAKGQPATSPTKGPPPAPKVRRSTGTDAEVPVRASEKLPAGTLHIVHRETPNPDFQPGPGTSSALEGPYEVHVFVSGTAENTWIAVSENEALARLKLHEAMTGDAGGIGSRADLSPLRTLSPGGIGFGSLAGVVALFSGGDTTGALERSRAKLASVAQLPSAGTTPMFLSLAPRASGDKGGATLRISAALSIAAAIDVIQWIQ